MQLVAQLEANGGPALTLCPLSNLRLQVRGPLLCSWSTDPCSLVATSNPATATCYLPLCHFLPAISAITAATVCCSGVLWLPGGQAAAAGVRHTRASHSEQ